MDKPLPRAYRFGPFRVDLQRQDLTGADGASLNLSARAYDVLIFLLENRDRVVSKDELMKAVWPRSVVEENNLNQAVTILRRALGDRRDSPQFVRTVAGRGYRFVGEVSAETTGADVAQPVVAPSPAQPDTRRRRLLLGLGLGAVAAGGAAWLLQTWRAGDRRVALRSLAVLPFKPLLEGAGDPVMEFGMTDALITRLSDLPGLVVRPLSSARAYAAPDQDPLLAGREMSVDAVLEGHVLIRENRVRATARLLDVASGAALWSGTFEEPLDQFMAAQDALASQVVTALQIELSDRDRKALLDRPTNNVQAWQLYLNGRYHWERKTPEAFRRAVEYFEQAERLDPSFALAAVGQADSWAVLGVYAAMPPAEAFERAGAAVDRALQIAPEMPEALAAKGHVLVQGHREWRAGERLYRRALAAKSRLGQCRMWLANDCAFQGRLREALIEARRAQDDEPDSLTFAANVGLILYFQREYDTARAQLSPLVEAAPEFPLARYHLARVNVSRGAPGEAVVLLEGRRAETAGALSNLARAYAATGQRVKAAAELQRVEELGDLGLGVGFDLALIHVALGDRDAALASIERAIGDGSQMIGFMNSEPGLDAIREEPRFRAVSRTLGLG